MAGSTPQGGQTAEIQLAEARKAFFVMFGVMVVIWALQLLNTLSGHNSLSLYWGIRPLHPGTLPHLITAPFLHFGWTHLESNSGPLFVFGLLAAYRGVKRFAMLSVLVAVTSGLAVWFFQGSNTDTVGASGVIFGYFGYVVVRGLIDRHLIDTLFGLVMFASFAYILIAVVPGQPHVSWICHAGGLVGGLLGAWLLRDRRTSAEPGPGTTTSTGVHQSLDQELRDLGIL